MVLMELDRSGIVDVIEMWSNKKSWSNMGGWLKGDVYDAIALYNISEYGWNKSHEVIDITKVVNIVNESRWVIWVRYSCPGLTVSRIDIIDLVSYMREVKLSSLVGS